jgi:hypothetical protein
MGVNRIKHALKKNSEQYRNWFKCGCAKEMKLEKGRKCDIFLGKFRKVH